MKIRLVAAFLVVVCGISVSAQTGYSEQDVDEVFYACGICQSSGLEEYLQNTKNVDMRHKVQFVKGIQTVVDNPRNDAQKAYYNGAEFGGVICSKAEEAMKDVFGERQLVPAMKKRFVQKMLDGVTDRINGTEKYNGSQAFSIYQAKKEMFQAKLSNGQTLGSSLQQEADDMFYAYGAAMSEELPTYLGERWGISESNKEQFTQGAKDGGQGYLSPSMKAYYAGIEIGTQMAIQMVKGVEYEVFGEYSDSISQERHLKYLTDGFIAAMQHTARYDVEKAREVVNKKSAAIKQNILARKYGNYKEDCKKFMESNKQKPGIHVLPSGVQYKVITSSTGSQKPRSTSKVNVHYEGKLIDGTVFDSSFERKKSETFGVNQVISGWSEVLQLMPAGSIWEVYIPQELAYGEREFGKIKPFSALIFKIYLISIEEY